MHLSKYYCVPLLSRICEQGFLQTEVSLRHSVPVPVPLCLCTLWTSFFVFFAGVKSLMAVLCNLEIKNSKTHLLSCLCSSRVQSVFCRQQAAVSSGL